MGENVLGKAATAGGRRYEHHDPHRQLAGEDQKLVAQREKRHEQRVGHQIPGTPRQKRGCKRLEPEQGPIAPDLDRAPDDTVARFDGPGFPPPQPGQRKKTHKEPLQPPGVEEEAVAQQEQVGEFQPVADGGEEHELVAHRPAEEAVAADDEKDDRKEQGEVELVEKRGEHHDRCAPADGHALFVDEDDRDAGSADGRGGHGGGELPQHGDPKGLSPAEVVAAEEAQADDVAEVATGHEHKGDQHEQQGAPGETDRFEYGGVELAPDHPRHPPEPQYDREDDFPEFDATDGIFLHRKSCVARPARGRR